MDWLEILVSLIVIGAAIGVSDWLMRAMEPKVDTDVDHGSPHIRAFEQRNQR